MKRVVVRVIGDDTVEVDGGRHSGRVFIPESDLGLITGWVLKPEGLCRDDACVLVPGRAVLGPDGWIDVASLGAAVGQPVAVEAAAGLAVIGHSAAERAESLSSLTAPDVRLPTVAGSSAGVYDFAGSKRLVVVFASWCGCRYDLPTWQTWQDRFGDNNFCVLAVAVDESVDVVRPWVDEAKATYPVLVDADRTFVDAYGIRNVPTVIWIDEDDRIVRPNSPEFDDAALERWIVDGQKPYESDAAVRADQLMPDEDQQLARAEYRLALELWRIGEKDLAERHFVRAGALAPYDFTIRRGSMPLRDQDPFGAPFFELYREWEAAGRPYYTEPAENQ